MEFKIPKRFKLMGQTINVSIDENDFINMDNWVGMAVYRTNKICILPSTDKNPISQEQMHQTFFHELMHFITYHAGSSYSGKEEYMHKEEGFVELMGSLLHQAIITFEGDVYEKE
jgi:predicted SprT family Zn-dependent metalloprotease